MHAINKLIRWSLVQDVTVGAARYRVNGKLSGEGGNGGGGGTWRTGQGLPLASMVEL